MERVYLSKDEKVVLRMLVYTNHCTPSFPQHTFCGCVRTLEQKGLVKGAWVEGGGLEDAYITSFGKEYMAFNPSLRNPINWGVVGTIVGIIGTITAIVALFVACEGLK